MWKQHKAYWKVCCRCVGRKQCFIVIGVLFSCEIKVKSKKKSERTWEIMVWSMVCRNMSECILKTPNCTKEPSAKIKSFSLFYTT